MTPPKLELGKRRRSLKVELGERAYPIRIGWDTLQDLGPAVVRATRATQVALVTVPEVGRRYGGSVTRSLRAAGLEVHRFEVPDGDATKNLKQAAKLYDAFLAKGMDRTSAVVALGGGMVGDLAGFVAATFLRGIAFVQVPTTLLAMVDASVGGKVGVNLQQGKNLVGAFHQPKLVWIDARVLETMTRRGISAGLAEVIKAAAIRDSTFFRQLEDSIEALQALDPVHLLPVLERACAIKAAVVARDERESGLRKILNFGHTLGHVVEQASGYRGVLHGEAVAMGMVFAAGRSEDLDYAPPGTQARLAALVERAGLPGALPELPRRVYLEGLRVDKKRVGDRISFVVLKRIGRSAVVPLLPAEILPTAFPRRRD
ncbi:MAG: 3-dehydroquinate synthase [Myxococcota bacterium]